MAIDQKTPTDVHPIDFEKDVIQRRPLTTQTGMGGHEPRMIGGVLSGDDNMVFTTVNQLVNWARSLRPWPLGYGPACCAIETVAPGCPRPPTRPSRAAMLPAHPRPTA